MSSVEGRRRQSSRLKPSALDLLVCFCFSCPWPRRREDNVRTTHLRPSTRELTLCSQLNEQLLQSQRSTRTGSRAASSDTLQTSSRPTTPSHRLVPVRTRRAKEESTRRRRQLSREKIKVCLLLSRAGSTELTRRSKQGGRGRNHQEQCANC